MSTRIVAKDRIVDPSAPSLNEDETREAVSDLVNTTFLKKYPVVERRGADSAVPNQSYFLLSFVPAPDATPNAKGLFGFAKVRGSYATIDEAERRAEKLIRDEDSAHEIKIGHVGRPFPITASSTYVHKVSTVEMKKDVDETYSADVKAKKEKEEREAEEMKSREKELLEDVKREKDDPKFIEDSYITLRVKKAQLLWTYLETEKKMKEMQESLVKTHREIEDMDATDPSLKRNYFKKYMDARRASGLDEASHQDNFVKYMGEDIELPFL
jgi:hypothetical protein